VRALCRDDNERERFGEDGDVRDRFAGKSGDAFREDGDARFGRGEAVECDAGAGRDEAVGGNARVGRAGGVDVNARVGRGEGVDCGLAQYWRKRWMVSLESRSACAMSWGLSLCSGSPGFLGMIQMSRPLNNSFQIDQRLNSALRSSGIGVCNCLLPSTNTVRVGQ
jgi:hypothetical protein